MINRTSLTVVQEYDGSSHGKIAPETRNFFRNVKPDTLSSYGTHGFRSVPNTVFGVAENADGVIFL